MFASSVSHIFCTCFFCRYFLCIFEFSMQFHARVEGASDTFIAIERFYGVFKFVPTHHSQHACNLIMRSEKL